MPALRTHEVGAAPGTCRRCGAMSVLTVRETRYVRGWSDLLSRDFDPARTRTATCGTCLTTYPVRVTDVVAAPAARRRDALDEPHGRDWAYPATGERRAEQGVSSGR